MFILSLFEPFVMSRFTLTVCAPLSTDRFVEVTGELDKLVSALSYIFDVVSCYYPINFDTFFANEYGC